MIGNRSVSLVVGAILVALVGCGQVGITCPTSGSTEGCAEGFVCTFVLSDAEPDNLLPPLKVCLRQCETATDCSEAEVCRVVFCTDDFRSCQTGPVPDFPGDLCTQESTDDMSEPG